MVLADIIYEKFSNWISDAEQVRAIRNAFDTVKKRQNDNINRISNLGIDPIIY